MTADKLPPGADESSDNLYLGNADQWQWVLTPISSSSRLQTRVSVQRSENPSPSNAGVRATGDPTVVAPREGHSQPVQTSEHEPIPPIKRDVDESALPRIISHSDTAQVTGNRNSSSQEDKGKEQSVQHSASHVAVDTRLLTAMMASTSVSNDNPSGSLPSTLSSHPESTPRSPSLETLLFYHQDVVVPVPAGMVPLPPLPSDERPIKPERSMASSQQHRFYLSFVSTLPGLSFMPWNMWRPRIESHRGFPKPYRPDFRAPDNREQALKWWSDRLKNSTDRESPVRVLPPPPRPPVTVDGPHWWVVYVGRVPGIYDNANDVIAQTREFLGAQAEIFSDEDAARRWYWYARAQGFLVPRY